MCGIAGFLTDRGIPDARGTLQRMTRSLRHRGPDDREAPLLPRRPERLRVRLRAAGTPRASGRAAGVEPLEPTPLPQLRVRAGTTFDPRGDRQAPTRPSADDEPGRQAARHAVL